MPSNSVPEYSNSSSFFSIPSASRLLLFPITTEDPPDCLSILSTLANAIIFIIAGVPASNLSGAPANITQPGETRRAVPPPLRYGILPGNAFLCTAIALKPIGNPISRLEMILYRPGFNTVVMSSALLGVQNITTYLSFLRSRYSSTLSLAESYRLVVTLELCPLPR